MGFNTSLGLFSANSLATTSERLVLSNAQLLQVSGLLLTSGATFLYLVKDAPPGATSNEVMTRRRVKIALSYVMGGLVTTGISAFGLCAHGNLDAKGCAIVSGLGIVAAVPLAIGTIATDYHRYSTLKHLFWCGLNVSVGASLCMFRAIGEAPHLCAAQVSLVARVVNICLDTAAICGILSYDGAGSGTGGKINQPLCRRLINLAGAKLGIEILPAPVFSTALWCGMLLVNGQQLHDAAQKDEPFDPINESLDYYFDTVRWLCSITCSVGASMGWGEIEAYIQTEKKFKGGDVVSI